MGITTREGREASTVGITILRDEENESHLVSPVKVTELAVKTPKL